MVRLEKNGLIREAASLEAAQEYIKQGFELREISREEVEEPLATEKEMREGASKLTVDQLTAQCKELGLEIPANSKKADLIELLVRNTIGAMEE